jgi:hypothetical protein
VRLHEGREEPGDQAHSSKWLEEESGEAVEDLPEAEELATDATAESEGAVEESPAVLTLL